MSVPQLPIAHAGHWITDLLIMSPLIAFGVWFVVAAVRDRRRGLDDAPPPPAP
jgi:hypothetical protein